MKKLLVFVILSVFLNISNAEAHNMDCCHNVKYIQNDQKEIDKMLDSRLHLTDEQKKYIKDNRPGHIREMKKTVSAMEDLKRKIRNVYLTGIPKYQADLRTATMKLELVMLKQNADRQKTENRKNFENILSPEQKIEFEKIKKEFNVKNNAQPQAANKL